MSRYYTIVRDSLSVSATANYRSGNLGTRQLHLYVDNLDNDVSSTRVVEELAKFPAIGRKFFFSPSLDLNVFTVNEFLFPPLLEMYCFHQQLYVSRV